MKDNHLEFTIGPDEAPMIQVKVNKTNWQYWKVTLIILGIVLGIILVLL